MSKSPLSLALALTGLFSVLFIFFGVSSFFRHDDWMMLGNGVILLPTDWSFMWEPTLYFSPLQKGVWFFRPFFKGIIWLVFQIFQFKFLGWILIQWLMFLGCIGIGALALSKLSHNKLKGTLFFFLMISSFSLFAPNIIWVGEGMMNLPQLLLLSLGIYFFSVDSSFFRFLSIPFYLFALGFKESGVFLPVFLWMLSIHSHRFRKDRSLLIVHFLLMGLYLTIRLRFMPLNPGYLPDWILANLFRPLALFVFFTSLPFISLLICRLRIHHAILISFLPFIGLLVAPHLGHPFFSPGWLLLPGYFFVWILAFACQTERLRLLPLKKLVLITLFISSIPVLWEVNQLDWLDWGTSQRQVFESLNSLNPEPISNLVIESCPDPKKPTVTFERVVAPENGLEHLWMLQHNRQIHAQIVPCGTLSARADLPSGTAIGKWNFPNFRLE